MNRLLARFGCVLAVLLCGFSAHAAYPFIADNMIAVGTVGLPFAYQFIDPSVDPGTIQVRFPVWEVSPGLVLDPADRWRIVGTPSVAMNGEAYAYVTIGTQTYDQWIDIDINQSWTQPPAPVAAPPNGSFVGDLNATAVIGTDFSFRFIAGNVTSFSNVTCTALPAGLTLDAQNATISGVPSQLGVTSVVVGVTVAGVATEANLAIYGVPPFIAENMTTEGTAGMPFNYQFIAVKLDPVVFTSGGGITVTGLPLGLVVNASDPRKITGVPAQTGSTNATLSFAYAGVTTTATLSTQIGEPFVSSDLFTTGTAGVPLAYQFITLEIAPSVTITATGLPPGLALDANDPRIITGTPAMDGYTQATVMLTVDGVQTWATVTLAILPSAFPPPNAPFVSAGLTADGTLGQPFDFQFINPAIDPSTLTSVTVLGLPDGLALDANDWTRITGTPTQVGTTTALLSVVYSAVTSTAQLSITITQPGIAADSPFVSANMAFTGVAGAELDFSVFNGFESNVLSLTADGLPPGLAVNIDFNISGETTQTGTTTAVITANEGWSTYTANATITITAAPELAPLVGTVGLYVDYILPAPWTQSSDFPEGGLSLNSDDFGNYYIQGVPLASGTTTAILTDENNDLFASLSMTINLAATPAPVIGTVGVPLSYTLSQAYDSAQDLPAGLILNGGDVISGTPLVAGTTAATLNSQGTLTNLTVTIDAATLNAVGTVGQLFNCALALNWTNVSGLPEGLWFSGQTITGIPAQAGTTTVVLSANDGSLGNLVLTIDPAQAPIEGTVGVPFAYSLPAGWTVVSALPAGLNFDTMIDGTPTQSGTTTIVIASPTGAVQSDLTLVIDPRVGKAPAVKASSKKAIVNQPFSYSVKALRATAFSATGLPPGLTLDAQSGTISGTPAQTGKFRVSLSASNIYGSTHRNWVLVVVAAKK